jgi:hypothetical protein
VRQLWDAPHGVARLERPVGATANYKPGCTLDLPANFRCNWDCRTQEVNADDVRAKGLNECRYLRNGQSKRLAVDQNAANTLTLGNLCQ